MNKYQEALDNIVRVSCPKGKSCRECDFIEICNCEAKSYIDKLQELVDKETPKKVITKNKHMGYGTYEEQSYCSRCGANLTIEYGYAYCHRCGQALDWSDKDE
ncbi:MAG: hypothetical protein ACLUVC_02255 [Longibaculum sp.]